MFIAIACSKSSSPQQLILGNWPVLGLRTVIKKGSTTIADSLTHMPLDSGYFINFINNNQVLIYMANENDTVDYKLSDLHTLIIAKKGCLMLTYPIKKLTDYDLELFIGCDTIATSSYIRTRAVYFVFHRS